jgi:RNA polymerase sigma-70 factor, ECF subfamily
VAAAVHARDEVARLYERYGYFVLRRCLVLLRQRAAAEDALQEVFVKVLRIEVSEHELERPLAWLYRIADNVCFDVLRRKKVRATEPEAALDFVGPHPAVRLEDRDAVMAVLGELDDRDRRICVMAFVDGLTQDEIASELDLSRVTVNKRIQAIRAEATRLLSSPKSERGGAA